MQKIIAQDFRPTKEFVLPISKVTLVCYPSVLIKELDTFKVGDSLDSNLELLAKVIKEWNLYEKAEDEQPLPINAENIKRLPSSDFEFFAAELKSWIDSIKKNSATSGISQ